jgi:hypothetical protein
MDYETNSIPVHDEDFIHTNQMTSPKPVAYPVWEAKKQ